MWKSLGVVWKKFPKGGPLGPRTVPRNLPRENFSRLLLRLFHSLSHIPISLQACLPSGCQQVTKCHIKKSPPASEHSEQFTWVCLLTSQVFSNLSAVHSGVLHSAVMCSIVVPCYVFWALQILCIAYFVQLPV